MRFATGMTQKVCPKARDGKCEKPCKHSGPHNYLFGCDQTGDMCPRCKPVDTKCPKCVDVDNRGNNTGV